MQEKNAERQMPKAEGRLTRCEGVRITVAPYVQSLKKRVPKSRLVRLGQ